MSAKKRAALALQNSMPPKQQTPAYNVFIPVICYNHTANTSYMMSLIGLTHHLKDKGIAHTLYPITFDSLVSRARNAATAHFLQSDCTHLMFIDSDISFQAESVIKLLEWNKDMIAGVYPKKQFFPERVALGHEAIDFPLAGKVMENDQGLLHSDYLPTGFLMIRRNVFDKMIIAYPGLKYRNDINAYGDGDTFYDFFQVSVRNGILESEDWGFCTNWKAIGGEVLVDLSIQLAHHGWTHFIGDPKKWCHEALKRISDINAAAATAAAAEPSSKP